MWTNHLGWHLKGFVKTSLVKSSSCQRYHFHFFNFSNGSPNMFWTILPAGYSSKFVGKVHLHDSQQILILKWEKN